MSGECPMDYLATGLAGGVNCSKVLLVRGESKGFFYEGSLCYQIGIEETLV